MKKTKTKPSGAFARQLRGFQRSLKLKPQQLAAMLQTSETQCRRWLTGTTTPYPITRQAIVATLQTALDQKMAGPVE